MRTYEITLMDKIADDLGEWIKEDLPNSYSAFIQQDKKLGSIIRGESFNRVLNYLRKHDSEKEEQLYNLQLKIGYQMTQIALNYKNRDRLFEFLGSTDNLETVLEKINIQNEIDELFAEIRKAKQYALNIIDLLRDAKGNVGDKIIKLTDFIRENCEDTTSISSKANRIHEFVKHGKINFMPKPVNKTKGNETKLYKEKELQVIWLKLKEKIKSLPNLKA